MTTDSQSSQLEPTTLSKPPFYDCVIFSGGGAKGAYGAGAAKALEEFRRKKHIKTEVCYLGTSAGALNAAVMAIYNADTLLKFWRDLTTRQILGVRLNSFWFQAAKSVSRRMLPFLARSPFSIYANNALKRLISSNVQFTQLHDRHLIIALTNTTTGDLRSFANTPYYDLFLAEDGKATKLEERRLRHWRPLRESNLVDALMASCSIPLFFPPVMIDGESYIDGGVGNNTPTREAAYFLRFLRRTAKGAPGVVYCANLTPARIRQSSIGGGGPFDILLRTIEVFYHVHTKPIIDAWNRINREVRKHEDRVNALIAWVQQQEFAPEVKARLIPEIQSRLPPPGGIVERLDIPLHIVEPSRDLGNVLDFDRDWDDIITQGYLDTLRLLKDKLPKEEEPRPDGWPSALSDVEFDELANTPL